ncbi:MAG: hypothetical protein VW930_06015, partial [Burkholderiaceae bacterium]
MSSLVSIILTLAIAVGLALTLGSGGSVTFFWQGYRADLALATFFILMLLSLFLIFTIIRLFSTLYGFPGRLLSLRNSKLIKKKQDLLHEIIISALLQDSFKLKSALKRYRRNFWERKKNSIEKRIVCLVAINSGEEIFDLVETRGWIDELKVVESELDVRYRRGELAEAEFAIREGKPQGLAKLLLDFLTDNPKSVFGRTLLVRVLLSEGRWEEVIQQVRTLSKFKKNISFDLKSTLYTSIENLLLEEGLSSIKINRAAGLLKKEEFSDRRVVGLLAQSYFSVGEREQATNLLESYLNKKWDAELGKIYWNSQNNTKLQLRMISKWEKRYGEFDSFHICFGNICISEKLWGKAKDHLFEAIRIQPTVDAFASLGRLYELTGEPEKANKFWKKAAKLFSYQHN